ncbi:unnamed protein product [Pylaiella littoralis]
MVQTQECRHCTRKVEGGVVRRIVSFTIDKSCRSPQATRNSKRRRMLAARLARASLRGPSARANPKPWPAGKSSQQSCVCSNAPPSPLFPSSTGSTGGLTAAAAAAVTARQQCSLARSAPIGLLGKSSSSYRACNSSWACSLTKRGAGVGRARTAGLSTRFRAPPRVAGTTKGDSRGSIGTAGIGSGTRSFSSFLPRGGSTDSMIVYGMVGLNVAGTIAMYLHTTEGMGGPHMALNFMVSTATTLNMGRLHTLFTSNFSHSNLWNGAIFSYMMYTLGPTAIQHLGRQQFLALYLLGGAFAQLCQVLGPNIARRLGLPTVLQVDPYFISAGGSGAIMAILAWYCASFPGSQIILMVVPVQTGVAGALYLGATLYQVVTNGDAVPLLGGPTEEIWRTLGAVAAGVLVALSSRGRGGGRYKFIQRF